MPEIVAGSTESSQTFVFLGILFPVPDLETGNRSLMPMLDPARTGESKCAFYLRKINAIRIATNDRSKIEILIFRQRNSSVAWERAEPLSHSLNCPVLLYSALMGQWRFSHMTDKQSAAMQIAERVHSLAQEQNDSTLNRLMVEGRAPLETNFPNR
jgi:hypothetical protein